ncbi:hypothetical protein M0R45_024432 [Rubus argutus]|uniref:Endonuclease/exonuclease/phosphatase domain-containing protein n=1 Tax=Rubus argutus TaxID=59490 RepID=A0AAW1WU59_RUBAR
MNILCWNCQGLGNPWTVQGLKGMLSLNFPSLVFLCETKCSVVEMSKIKFQLGWRNVFAVPCSFVPRKGGKGVSRAGGIALLWNDSVPVALNSYSSNHIDVLVGASTDPKRWRFTGFYGQPKVTDRHQSWSLLKLLSQKSQLPWLMGGDFNEILESHEKEGGQARCARQMIDFREAVQFCSLSNIHAMGPRFTWRGMRGGY